MPLLLKLKAVLFPNAIENRAQEETSSSSDQTHTGLGLKSNGLKCPFSSAAAATATKENLVQDEDAKKIN
jgi:hypothetical protein